MSALADEIRAYASANDNLPMESSSSGLIDSISNTFGKVADFGFNLQSKQYDVQSKAQDNQLKSLLGNLGFQTAVVKAQSENQIAQIQAQRAVSNAVSGTTGFSPIVLMLGAGMIYLLAKKG